MADYKFAPKNSYSVYFKVKCSWIYLSITVNKLFGLHHPYLDVSERSALSLPINEFWIKNCCQLVNLDVTSIQNTAELPSTLICLQIAPLIIQLISSINSLPISSLFFLYFNIIRKGKRHCILLLTLTRNYQREYDCFMLFEIIRKLLIGKTPRPLSVTSSF